MHGSRKLAEEYTQISADYATHWEPVIRPMAKELFGTLPMKDAWRVLDVGTGTGAHLNDFAESASKGRVVGVDMSEGMLSIAKQRSNSAFAVMNAEELAIVPDTFDVATLIFVLFHLPNPVDGLREVGRVLRPGGVVGLTTWGEGHGVPGNDIWIEELDALGAGPDPRNPRVVQHDRMDTLEKLEGLLHGAGYELIRVWNRTSEYRWSADALLELQAGIGLPMRRLQTLSPQAQSACHKRVAERFTELSKEDLTFRPDVLFATGRMS